MNTTTRLIGIALIPFITTLILYFVLQSKSFQNTPYKTKQLVVGIIFGFIAILATEYGVPYNQTIINVRDAAPICASLFFGPTAGIIAALIGGIERWFCVYWGGGYYTRIACTIATILSGLIASYFKKYIFENRNPDWLLALFVGFICETIHMILIFITNLNNVTYAFEYVKVCSAPMILINSITVSLVAFFINRIEKETQEKQSIPTISSQYQKYLILVVVIGFLITSIITFVIERQISIIDTYNQMVLNIDDLHEDVKNNVDYQIYRTATEIGEDYYHDLDIESIKWLADYYRVSEIFIVDKNGIVIDSTNDNLINFNLSIDSNLTHFTPLIKGEDDFGDSVEQMDYLAYDHQNIDSEFKKYAGVKYEDHFIIISLENDSYKDSLNEIIIRSTANRRIGGKGSLMVVDNKGYIIADELGYKGKNVKDINLEANSESYLDSYERHIFTNNKNSYYYTSLNYSNYDYFAFYDKTEADFMNIESILMNTFMQTLVFGLMFVVIYYVTKQTIVKDINQVNDDLDNITKGNLDTVVAVNDNEEFISLSNGINLTVDALKELIKEANERIDSELNYAKQIQFSSLPTNFPAFPEHDEFDLYALMDPAKEVGGDFYDFYMINDYTIVFLVADVSGKGIPGALFMMRSKTTIRNYAESGISLGEAFTKANNRLCEENEAGMFVTSWIGMLDLRNGNLRYANAGHNPPLLKRKDGTYEYLKGPAAFVLAGMKNINYKEQNLTLNPGDEIFVYSDGVVEATNIDKQLYGEQRLQDFLNTQTNKNAMEICNNVHNNVEQFYDGVEQFDDITELSLRFLSYSDTD